MYKPTFEQDLVRHIPNSLKQKYLEFLIYNIGLFADSEKNENRKQFLQFLLSREAFDVVQKQGPLILYNDENLKYEQ